jgi:putative nucleotidyltransferase with HDIG domain
MEALLRPTPNEVPIPGSAPPEPTLDALFAALEVRIPGIGDHCRRVARLAAGTARELQLSSQQVAGVAAAAAIHDIGKIEMPAAIVNKPGSLSAEEFAVVRKHASAGARLVARLGDGELAPIVRHHHERFDGGGYPHGLAGTQIPLGARIVAVADTFDALTSIRPYRPPVGWREAMDVLAAEAGSQLDPGVVAAFRSRYSGLSGSLLRVLGR